MYEYRTIRIKAATAEKLNLLAQKSAATSVDAFINKMIALTQKQRVVMANTGWKNQQEENGL